MFDAAGSGFINAPDVQAVLRSMGQELDLAESAYWALEACPQWQSLAPIGAVLLGIKE